MGRTSKPLTILIHPDLADCEGMQALRARGHTVYTFEEQPGLVNLDEFDVIFSKNAWRMTMELVPYLESAIQTIRKEKYGKQGAEDG